MRIRAWVARRGRARAGDGRVFGRHLDAGDGRDDPTATGPQRDLERAGGGGDADQVTIVGFAFEPSTVTAGEGGDTIDDHERGRTSTHTFTLDDGSVDEDARTGAPPST